MKEVTYEEWIKNPTPRMMWCWDNCEKPRRMTHKELSRWLREKPTREYKRSNRTDIGVNYFYSYIEEDADQEVDEFYLIREDDGEWREPLVEVE